MAIKLDFHRIHYWFSLQGIFQPSLLPPLTLLSFHAKLRTKELNRQRPKDRAAITKRQALHLQIKTLDTVTEFGDYFGIKKTRPRSITVGD